MSGVPSFLARRSRKGLPPPVRAQHKVESVAEPVVEPVVEPVAEPVVEAPSLDMTRAELNALAESLGIESPDKLANKQAVLDAILAKQG